MGWLNPYHTRVRRLALLLMVMTACEASPADVRAPVIESARPVGGARVGVQVTLLGHNFGLRGAEDVLTFGGQRVEVESWADRELLLRMPAETRPGFGRFVVRAGARVSAPFTYEVLPPEPPDGGDGGAPMDGGAMDGDVGDFTP